MPRNRRRKEERPDEIVEAAFTEFSEQGYADTRLDKVAARAGVSKGLVYLYFKTKEELFKAVVRRFLVPKIEGLRTAVLEYEGSIEAFFRGPLQAFARDVIDSPVRHVLRLLIAEGPKHPDLTAFYHDEVITRGLSLLRVLVERGETSGEFRSTRLGEFPQLIVAPVVVALLWRVLFERHAELDTDALIDTHIDLLANALRPGS